MEVIIALIQNQQWFGIVASVVALASAIAAVTPTPAPGTLLAKVYSIVDLLALNVGKAKDTGKN